MEDKCKTCTPTSCGFLSYTVQSSLIIHVVDLFRLGDIVNVLTLPRFLNLVFNTTL
jgi:hypothetical protein